MADEPESGTCRPAFRLAPCGLQELGKQLREFRAQALAQICADVDGDRERSLELLVIGNAGVDENAVVEVARKEQRITLGGPGFLDGFGNHASPY